MLVTFGLVVKNCEATIRGTVESIASQDYSSEQIEVIVVDDGCRDATIPITVDRLSKTKMKVKVFRTGGTGLGKARQVVVDNAQGKYIIWVDGDLTLSRDYTRKQVEFMEKHTDVGKARGRWNSSSENSLVAWLESLRLIDYESKHHSTRFVGSMLVGVGGSACRLQALRQVGGFDPQIKGAGEDVDIAAKMLKAGWSLWFNDAEFHHKFKETWKALWNQYLWYGYGAHYVSQKHKGLVLVWTRIPAVALFSGLLLSFVAYKATGRKISFLLPIQYLFKQTAWCYGFVKGHFEKYGHI